MVPHDKLSRIFSRDFEASRAGGDVARRRVSARRPAAGMRVGDRDQGSR